MFGSAVKVMLAPVFFDINRLRFVVLGGTAIAVFGIACGGPEVIALGVPLFSRCVSFVFLCGRVQHIATLRRFTPSP